jgi:hypothetical protein
MAPGSVDAIVRLYGPLYQLKYGGLPHEICHVFFFKEHGCKPLPRWADEGAATSVESREFRANRLYRARDLVSRNQHLPLTEFIATSEYPQEDAERDIFYLQSASFAAWILRDGPSNFLKLVRCGDRCKNAAFVSKELGYDSVEACEKAWQKWLLNDSHTYQKPNALLVQQ